MRAIRVCNILYLVGCGDDSSVGCPLVDRPDGFMGRTLPTATYCQGALRFAAKYSPTITPTQQEVDRYFDRWTRANLAEPALDGGGPQRYRGNPSVILSTNQKVVDVLTEVGNHFADGPGSRSIIPTGDASFDDVLSQLVFPEILFVGTVGQMPAFGLSTAAIHNQEVLNSQLSSSSSSLGDFVVAPRQDGSWSWDGEEPGSGDDSATAIIDSRIGWGDCIAGCEGLHDLRAIVPADGEVQVFDVGGDPLPPFITLSPNTVPLPD